MAKTGQTRRTGPLFALFAAFLLLSCCAVIAHAPAPAAAQAGRPIYEATRTAKLLEREGLVPASAPEGKIIAWVRVVRDEVFVKDEVFPYWLNIFHALSREKIVRRELLFEVGKPYADARIEETMRNLRGMGIFALARITAVRTQDPNQVGIVVHTRDLWSLRLETSFSASTFVDSLLVRLTERNLFGYNKALGADVTLLPKSYTLSETYYARRVLNSDIALSQRAGLVFNRASQNVEGKIFTLSTGAPFYALKQRLSYTADGSYDSRISRALRGDQLLAYRPEGSAPDGPFAFRAYRYTLKTAVANLQYRVGSRFKHTWLLGWDYRALKADPVAETELPDELRDAFRRDILPRERTESGPITSYDFFTPSFATLNNLSTYGQSENIRTGPRVTLGLRLPRRSFGSSIASSVLSGTVSYTMVPYGGYLDASASGVARYERSLWVDQRAQFRVRMASPVFSYFRFVSRIELELRRNDTTNAFVSLGTDNGLRGHVARSVYGVGQSSALGNFELRTLPIAWQAVHVGGVLFYDVGSVFPSARALAFHHAVGLGIRVLFPQFNRYPFSFDAGMAADRDFGFVPNFASGQSIPLTPAEEPAQ